MFLCKSWEHNENRQEKHNHRVVDLTLFNNPRTKKMTLNSNSNLNLVADNHLKNVVTPGKILRNQMNYFGNTIKKPFRFTFPHCSVNNKWEYIWFVVSFTSVSLNTFQKFSTHQETKQEFQQWPAALEIKDHCQKGLR